ncbi:MAG TPA: LCP family protein [Anaerolineales bacterium]
MALNTVAAPTATPTTSFTPTFTPTSTPTPTATLTPTPTEIPTLCGGPRVMFILLIGSDARSKTYNVGLADAIRLVRVDFVEPRVQLLTFQRDLYVEIPGIESHNGITHGKLNQAFLYGNPGYGYFDGPGQGSGLLALTLEHNFDVHADHYLAVNLQTFSAFIDALGGIDIRLPDVIDGRVEGSKDPNRYFKAGDHHLNGYRTMLLSRLRPKGDLQRSEIQNLILQAITEKVLSPSVLPKLPELAKTFNGSIQSDLGPTEIGQLVCLAAMLDMEKIEYVSFPESLFKSARVQDPVLGYTSILEVDFEILKKYVRNFENGIGLGDVGEIVDDEVDP